MAGSASPAGHSAGGPHSSPGIRREDTLPVGRTRHAANRLTTGPLDPAR